MSERYTTARMPSARPLGARSVMEGTYSGTELANTSARPGAYDAMKLPSLISGRQVSREQQRAELLAPLPAPPAPASHCAAATDAPESVQLPHPVAPPTAVPQPAAATVDKAPASYRPREGSGPHRVLQHLKEHGGHLLYADICRQFDIPTHSLTAIFKPALARGALVQLQIQIGESRRRALALPGYVPPTGVKTVRVGDVVGRVQMRHLPEPRPADPFASSAADLSQALQVAAPAVAELRRALEHAGRLLQQLAAALPSSLHQ
ncbi:hypothetical protein J2789_004495 [Variovorax paradoxus]|uniref:hypothetical protein n=1 Tax=Variovorax atrisoli TaxID=3394203 RepID=UPI001199FDE4|nr:hypothetical protein [Variovorax paradoxus]MDR6521805.1 hypothetical protein [Variovorax paradoxus]